MADKSFILRLEARGGDLVVKELERVGVKGEEAGAKTARGFDSAADGAGVFGRASEMAAGKLDDFSRRGGAMGAMLEGLGSKGRMAAVGLGVAVAAVAALTGPVTAAVQRLDDLGDAAERLGIRAETLQALQFGQVRSGGNEADVVPALTQLRGARAAALSNVRGSETQMKLFAELGISATELRGLADTEALLRRVADALTMVDQASRIALAEKLGIASLLPLLKQGADGLDEVRAAAERLGVIIPEDVIKRAGELNDQWKVMSLQLNNVLTPALIAMGETATAVLGTIVAIVQEITRALPDALAIARGDVAGFASERAQEIDAAARAKAEAAREESTREAEHRARLIGIEASSRLAAVDPLAATRGELARQRLSAAPGALLVVPESDRPAAPAVLAPAGARRTRSRSGDDAAQRDADDDLKVLTGKLAAAESAARRTAQAIEQVDWASKGAGEQIGVLNKALSLQIKSFGDLLDVLADVLMEFVRLAGVSAARGEGGFFDILGSMLGGFVGDSPAPSPSSGFFSGLAGGTRSGRASGGSMFDGIFEVGERGKEIIGVGSAGAHVVKAADFDAMRGASMTALALTARASAEAARGSRQADRAAPMHVSLQMINQGPPLEADVRQKPGGGGMMALEAILKPMVESTVRKQMSDGGLDRAMRDRFGAAPVLGKR